MSAQAFTRCGVPVFEQHVEHRLHGHERREHGRALRALLADALDAAADVGARSRQAARELELERRDDLDPATRAVIADALRTAELLAEAAWQRLAASSVRASEPATAELQGNRSGGDAGAVLSAGAVSRIVPEWVPVGTAGCSFRSGVVGGADECW